MSANEIEIILSRQLADCLSQAIFIVDTEGSLIFYNEPAERLLGLRFEETGIMPVTEWSTIFQPEDDDGNALTPEKLPLVRTLTNQSPAHGELWIRNLKGSRLKIIVTALPIFGRPHRFLGAKAIFWKID